ncbi:MAG: HPr family phosphocarrier protein [Candidatus Flemingiibacterium sp.]
MQEVKIKLSSVNDVNEFVSTISCFDCGFDIDTDRSVVDAKSIMGIFSLDLSKVLSLKIHSSDENDIMKIKGKIEKFIVV